MESPRVRQWHKIRSRQRSRFFLWQSPHRRLNDYNSVFQACGNNRKYSLSFYFNQYITISETKSHTKVLRGSVNGGQNKRLRLLGKREFSSIVGEIIEHLTP